VTLPLPPEAVAADTQFRWRGPENCSACHFALDDGKNKMLKMLNSVYV